MENFIKSKILAVLNALLFMCVSCAAGAGIFVRPVYARESLLWGAQGMGQDVVTLAVVMPAMIISFLLAKRGNRAALFIWLGSVVYLAYSYIVYCYAAHFNMLFLLYCACLGLSVYTLIAAASIMRDVNTWFEEKINTASVIYLLAVSLLFYALWLAEIIPALLNGTVPKSVTDAGLLVNPVHVNDLALLLPAFIVSSVLLLKKRPAGYLFFPAMMVFGLFMDLAIIGMMVMMKLKGAAQDISQVYIFGGLTALQTLFLWMFMKGMKKYKHDVY
jgi:hypothetical protein